MSAGSRQALHLIALALLIICSAALIFSSVTRNYDHPDEEIATNVARYVLDNSTLDTNFKNVELDPFFKYPQYNFSAYNLSAALVLAFADATAQTTAASDLLILRVYSAVLSLLVILLTFLLGRRIFDSSVALLAAVFVAVNAQLYQDSLFARAELFVTCLIMVALCLVLRPWMAAAEADAATGRGTLESSGAPRLVLFVAACVMGLCVATKVSMLAMVPVLFLRSTRHRSASAAPYSLVRYVMDCVHAAPQAAVPIAVGLLLGFVCGVPYALVNFDDYIYGIAFLQKQYAQGFWLHGLPDGTLWQRAGHSLDYFMSTQGIAVFVFALVGGVAALRQRQYAVFFLMLLVLAFFIRFGTFGTFFARNLTHLVPLYSLLAAYGVVASLRIFTARRGPLLVGVIFLGALVVYPGLRTIGGIRLQVLSGLHHQELVALRGQLQEQYGARSIIAGWTANYESLRSVIGWDCETVLLEVSHPGDVATDMAIAELVRQDDYLEVGRLATVFGHVPTSTLHTYFSPTRIFLTNAHAQQKRCSILEATGGPALRELGPLLHTRRLDSAPAWTERGAYEDSERLVVGGDYYASWSGSDANKGEMTLRVETAGLSHVHVPYQTGPVTDRQSIQLTDAATGEVLWRAAPLRVSIDWKYLRVPLPRDIPAVILQAVDAGDEWGEWHAVGVPRRPLDAP